MTSDRHWPQAQCRLNPASTSSAPVFDRDPTITWLAKRGVDAAGSQGREPAAGDPGLGSGWGTWPRVADRIWIKGAECRVCAQTDSTPA